MDRINSSRGEAPAGGGTRMRKGLNKHEVVSLAKTMEIKFTITGPAIGGAKSGINFDPKDPRKTGVLKKGGSQAAIIPLLKSYYGTGGDLNVDEIIDVLQITKSLWIRPLPNKVFSMVTSKPNKEQKIKNHRPTKKEVYYLRLKILIFLHQTSYRKYTVADMITGYGVSEAIKYFYQIHNEKY